MYLLAVPAEPSLPLSSARCAIASHVCAMDRRTARAGDEQSAAESRHVIALSRSAAASMMSA